MLPDVKKVANLIEEAAKREILPRFRRLGPSEVWEKRPGDPVTAADLAMERILETQLSGLAPGSKVVGEEGVSEHPDRLDWLAGGDPLWIVDPLDGTANFAEGVPRFAVIVAYCIAGEVRAGWIHDPLAGITAMAVQGQGAWIDHGASGQGSSARTRLRIASPARPERMTGRVSYRLRDRKLRQRLAERSAKLGQRLDLRCVGQEYLALARGEAHFALYFRLRPWDHAAGILIHREAGGYGAALGGTPYRPDPLSESVLLAPDKTSWNEIYGFLLGDSPRHPEK
jgi:fructose-1,6-bisphosphatase/inositol monophosphatase family enzyme